MDFYDPGTVAAAVEAVAQLKRSPRSTPHLLAASTAALEQGLTPLELLELRRLVDRRRVAVVVGHPAAVKEGWRALASRRHQLFAGVPPELASRAAAMAEDAVRACRYGQVRATVDARHPVAHAAAEPPDRRNSNRIRLGDKEWADLEEIRAAWGLPSRTAAARWAIEQALREVRYREREAADHE